MGKSSKKEDRNHPQTVVKELFDTLEIKVSKSGWLTPKKRVPKDDEDIPDGDFDIE